VAKDRTTIQAPDPGVGTPPRDLSRSQDVLLTEVAKLQSDGEYAKQFLAELRTDMRDLRDRMAKLEERVLHLPSKEFIVGVVVTALVIVGGLTTIAPKLWSWAGTTPVVSPPPSPPPSQSQRLAPQSN
jgi:hypothetical protein